MEQIEIRDVDLMEMENLLVDYYNFLDTLVEEKEEDNYARQAQMFRLENIIDLLDEKLGVLYDCNYWCRKFYIQGMY